MIKLGEMNTLKVERIEDGKIFLEEDIKLKTDQELNEGDEVEVFIYKTKSDNLKATTTKPLITVGKVAFLEVISKSNIGAFVNIGIDERDVLLPYNEHKQGVYEGTRYVMAMYIDKSGRLALTRRISDFLSEDSPYKRNDKVSGVIYSIDEEIGAFVAVDGKYNAMIPKREIYQDYYVGQEITGYVMRLKEDGKIDIRMKKTKEEQIDDDKEFIMMELYKNGGKLPVNDKSPSSEIRDRLNMSKNAFKRALGGLLKTKDVKQTEKGIEIVM